MVLRVEESSVLLRGTKSTEQAMSVQQFEKESGKTSG